MEVVRKLVLNDLEQILSLRIAIQNYDLKYINKDEIVLNQDQLIEKAKEYVIRNLDKSLFLFGLFIDDELVSNCGFYLDEHFPTYNNKSGYLGYVCNVFTKEKYRNKGYQKKVFDECLKYAKEIGITSFKLSSMNETAINMYKSFEFKGDQNTYSLKVQK